MPLRNRVTPLSELIADPARGLVYGNRGCLHDDRGEIRRRFATRRWIACRLEFNPLPDRRVETITPVSLLAVLRAGWEPVVPLVHPSATARA
jgi:hypothetical protein